MGVIAQADDWAEFAGADWPDRVMNEEVRDRHHAKQGRSIARWTLEHAGRRLVVYLKRHYVLPRWRAWLARLLPRRAWSPGLQEWQRLVWARDQGLPVPRPVAAMQSLSAGRLQSCLAVEELTDMLPLHEAVPLAAERAGRDFAAWKAGLIDEMARLVVRIHGQAVFHKDLYLCHFYIPESLTSQAPPNWQGRVHVIDLHRLSRHRVLSHWYRVKDLGQLLYSSEVAGVTARDRLRFWRAYRAGMGLGGAGLLARAARWKWGRYRRHNLKRRGRLT